MKKIGIDARFFGPKMKGLGRYSQKLIENLEELDGGSTDREYYIFLKKETFDTYQPQHSNFKKVEADFRWYTIKEQLAFPKFLNSFNLDLVHFCHFNVPILYRRPFLVTVHDLILFHFPTVRNTTLSKAYYVFKLFAYQLTIRRAVKKAKKVLAVSDFTKKDIMKELRVSEEKIAMTHEGCDFRCFVAPGNEEEVLKKYGIMRPYLLYVGNAYPHKNLERLVLAYQKIKKWYPGISLVLVGGKDFFYDRLEQWAGNRKVVGIVFPGYVPDEDLDVLYKNAELYVFPSLYEGFGLPPLEALAKNTPVVSSNKSSMPEILGGAAYYFDPEKTDSIAETIDKVLSSSREEIFSVQKTIRQLQLFSWEKMAKETFEEYKKLL